MKQYRIDYSEKGNVPNIPMYRVMEKISIGYKQVGKSFTNHKEAIKFKKKLEGTKNSR